MAQIGGYLTPEEHEMFQTYAVEFGLSESGLANLLLVREMRRQRLHDLKGKYAAGAPSDSRQRVTAHQRNAALKMAFDERSSDEGLKPDQAASIVYRAELDERWLERSVGGRNLESS
jgi:hypothetical protein